MRGVLAEPFGNPSSENWAGEPAKRAIANTRAQVAALLKCRPNEIVFTSGGSESNNHALKGRSDSFRAHHPAANTLFAIDRKLEDCARMEGGSWPQDCGREVCMIR
jgi:cysteine sulfinate desulfinase/cysteine desulfurase-like protein